MVHTGLQFGLQDSALASGPASLILLYTSAYQNLNLLFGRANYTSLHFLAGFKALSRITYHVFHVFNRFDLVGFGLIQSDSVGLAGLGLGSGILDLGFWRQPVVFWSKVVGFG